jgi:hypothetical protein
MHYPMEGPTCILHFGSDCESTRSYRNFKVEGAELATVFVVDDDDEIVGSFLIANECFPSPFFQYLMRSFADFVSHALFWSEFPTIGVHESCLSSSQIIINSFIFQILFLCSGRITTTPRPVCFVVNYYCGHYGSILDCLLEHGK